jgi:hypothetical protein
MKTISDSESGTQKISRRRARMQQRSDSHHGRFNQLYGLGQITRKHNTAMTA